MTAILVLACVAILPWLLAGRAERRWGERYAPPPTGFRPVTGAAYRVVRDPGDWWYELPEHPGASSAADRPPAVGQV